MNGMPQTPSPSRALTDELAALEAQVAAGECAGLRRPVAITTACVHAPAMGQGRDPPTTPDRVKP